MIARQPHSWLATMIAGLLTALGAADQVSMAQTLGGGGDVEIPFLRLAAALVVGLLIAFGAALLLKRNLTSRLKLPSFAWFNAKVRSRREIQVHEVHRLSVHADLCRFTAHDKDYVVLVSSNNAQVLSVVDRPDASSVEDVTIPQ